jgi:hypothetical protein
LKIIPDLINQIKRNQPLTKDQMKQTLLLFLTVFLSIPAALSQAGAESITLKPEDYKSKIAIDVAGKTRNYYPLSVTDPSVILVQGPGILKVHTRCQFKPGDKAGKKFTVVYKIDGGEMKSASFTSSSPSQQAVYKDISFGVPGELHTIGIELPRGNHSLEFIMKDQSCEVAARYVFTPSKLKKQEWQVFSPALPSEPVELVSSESTTNYYRFSSEKPLKVDIIGPTELRVLTRTENHYQMKGRINYRVQVREDGKVINTYQLSSKVSEVAVYDDRKDLVPGMACEFVIFVPAGKHVYEIVPLDQDKNTLLGRLLIPKKDCKLGQK